MPRNSKDSDTITIIYDDGPLHLQARRAKIAESCPYFNALLSGHFRESKQSEVRIHLSQDGYSFGSLETIVRFANEDGYLDRTREVSQYVNAIQLADLWLYDRLVDELELFLTSKVNLDNVVTIHNLALTLHLSRLEFKCRNLEVTIDKDPWVAGSRFSWPSCPFIGHHNHHFSDCTEHPQRFDEPEDDWTNIKTLSRQQNDPRTSRAQVTNYKPCTDFVSLMQQLNIRI